MQMRPAVIAGKLGVSTNALRHYEAWGIVPRVERAPNGYRIYTEEHIAYFECIRAMRAGFGMELTMDVLRRLLRKEHDDAMWMVNEAQAALNRKKLMADKTIQALDAKELDRLDARVKKRGLTIGQVSKETSIPASAIRHWEKMGLIEVTRDPDNGYRTFGPAQVRKIFIIGTLRSAVWSLDVVKQVIRELDRNDVEQARKVARDSLQVLHDTMRQQIRGIHYLHRLLELADPTERQLGV